VIERTLTFPGPVSPGHTLAPHQRGPGDPCLQIDSDGAIWRTSLMVSGPVTARITRAAPNAVHCQAWGDGAGEFADTLPGLLDSVYAQISSSAPNAHVIVTGYPRLFSPEHGVYFNASVAEQKALNSGADLLNKTIAKAAKRRGFQFVSVTKRFRDHGANAAKPWILGVMSPGRFHPSAKGYKAYTAAVAAAIKAARLK